VAAALRAEVDLNLLREVAWPRSQRVAQNLGRILMAPYLDPDFLHAAGSIPAAERARSEPPKALFREWALYRGLPPEVARRPKKALQFGSGVDRWLTRAASKPEGRSSAALAEYP